MTPPAPSSDLPDPREWPAATAASDTSARVHAAVRAVIESATGERAAIADARATAELERLIAARDGDALADVVASAPSFAIARHVWRLLAELERGTPDASTSLRTTLVAIPVAIVCALDAQRRAIELPGVLDDVRALQALLADAGEFGGARTFAFAPGLAGIDAIDIAALPALWARVDLPDARGGAPLDVPPAPIVVDGTDERVHVRFVVGAVLTAPGSDPLRESAFAHWGMTFAQLLSRQLTVTGVSLLALPRPPSRLLPAAYAGRAAQRDVAAQLFASNAIRRLRAAVGEPAAIISAHRARDAPGGGELRLSLSSPFTPRDAAGFRCPLYAYESVQDVAAMLAGLLRDCRVHDVRYVGGVHADIDPITGGPLLFKDAGTAPPPPVH
jgi:hypothetical protein